MQKNVTEFLLQFFLNVGVRNLHINVVSKFVEMFLLKILKKTFFIESFKIKYSLKAGYDLVFVSIRIKMLDEMNLKLGFSPLK